MTLSKPAVLALTLVVMLLRSGAAQAKGPQLVGPFTKDDYPQAVIDRPLTLPAGMVEVELGSRFTSRRFAPDVFEPTGADDTYADLAIRVGVTDRFQIEAGTAFSLDH